MGRDFARARVWWSRVKRLILLHVLATVLVLGCAASGQKASPLPTAQANDNRTAAGELKNYALDLHLELVETTWYPEQDRGPSLRVYGFSETGKAPRIPGPLIRVPQGTEIHATLHNTLPTVMFVRGLHSHAATGSEPLRVAPGEAVEVRFTASSPGSYYYSARSTKDSIGEVGSLPITEDLPMGEGPFGIEGQLNGGFIVDPPGNAADDRIFIITLWMRGVITPPFREIAAINGKSWPYTERLSHHVGDSVRWRILNPSVSDHAMHLHGFFFRVDSLGDGDRDKSYSPDEAPHAVTQHLPPGGTMSLTWTPERAGQWLFHCHMSSHMAEPSVASQLEPDSHASDHAGAEDSSGMRGLILGVTVTGDRAAPTMASDRKPRQLRLLVREKPATRFSLARMGYLIQEGAGAETSDPPSIPGPPLVLTRGEPVEITVVNQLKEETSVHWHGIELESYYDGVPGWSGASPQTTPPIPPGGSFLARMTPPRSGTFIYHTHWHDVAQLTSGLYGPLLVLEPGEKYDPAVDKIFIISRAGPDESESPLLLNGSPQPPPLVLKSGTKYRLRFINIAKDDSDPTVSLGSNGTPVSWRALAKDGWASPTVQPLQPAHQLVSVGETYDFEFIPERAGELTLQITLGFLRTQITQLITVH